MVWKLIAGCNNLQLKVVLNVKSKKIAKTENTQTLLDDSIITREKKLIQQHCY